MADEIAFDFDDLTIEEVEILEDITGLSIAELNPENGKRPAPQGKTLRAIVYIVNHRTNPDFTIDDAGRVKVTAVADMTNGNRAQRRARPTKASA